MRIVTESPSEETDLENIGQGHGFYIQSTIFISILNFLSNNLSENIYVMGLNIKFLAKTTDSSEIIKKWSDTTTGRYRLI